MNENIKKVIETIAAEVMQFIDIVAARPEINLKGSQLIRNAKVDVRYEGGSVVIETLFDNYVQYLEQGRKPRQGKQPPIDALRDWALERGIPTDNSTLFLIARAIWRDGQQPRPIIATLEEEIERRMESEWADLLFDAITEELNNLF